MVEKGAGGPHCMPSCSVGGPQPTAFGALVGCGWGLAWPG